MNLWAVVDYSFIINGIILMHYINHIQEIVDVNSSGLLAW